MNKELTYAGQIVDVVNGRIYPGEILVENGKIKEIQEVARAPKNYIAPGLVDAHIHIESSMITPSAFASAAAVHGTVATVSDPHEIANVCGMQGVDYMIADSRATPFYFNFGAPSCVPATQFESSGAVLDSNAVAMLLARPEIKYLSEMMNFPGVLNNDPEVLAKLAAAALANKPVDGHAPGLRGADAIRYAEAGISTDHECTMLDEAVDKVLAGMKIIIREGSAAKNFDALCELINLYPDRVMWCSDDKHPDDLIKSHIDALIRRAVGNNSNFIDVIRAATLNPVMHYKLENGLLRKGDSADFVFFEHPESFHVTHTYIKGELVAQNGKALKEYSSPIAPINNFNCEPIREDDIKVEAHGNRIRVIDVQDGQLATGEYIADATVVNGYVVSDIDKDVLKLVVVNRYAPSKPAVAFVKNMHLKIGALASSIMHDSHNIIAVGVDDMHIAEAINMIINSKGGIAVSNSSVKINMPLEVGGLMSTSDAHSTATSYETLHREAVLAGCRVDSPFMTLSFLGLLVIPSLKLSDKGLFDGNKFEFTNLFVD